MAELVLKGAMAVALFMALMGAGFGVNTISRQAMWAELTDLKNLGNIKGKDSLFIAIGTSLSPFVLGLALDKSILIQSILMTAIIAIIILFTISFKLYFNISKRIFH